MDINDKIYVAGHTGLIGSAILRRLKEAGYNNLLFMRHQDLDLTNSNAVDLFFDTHRPLYVFLAAGRVAGIRANILKPADFISINIGIQLNVLKAAHRVNVYKLILFGSSCMYPRDCIQPMSEALLMSGKPEQTSLPYAISKLAGLHMCLAYNQQYKVQRFIPVIPNTAYGPNDNFNSDSGHVIPALLTRFDEARRNGSKSLTLWGSGEARREFIHADDVADACLTILVSNTKELELPINLGTGTDISISELAEVVARVVKYKGNIKWDLSKPEGAKKKLLDSSRLREFGWAPKVNLEEGIRQTYNWYIKNSL